MSLAEPGEQVVLVHHDHVVADLVLVGVPAGVGRRAGRADCGVRGVGGKPEGGRAVGKTIQEAEALLPEQRVFIQRIRRGDKIMDATSATVIQAGDIVAVAGRREVLVNLIGTEAEEVDDRELLAVTVEGIDI